jgi:hypothetical protein
MTTFVDRLTATATKIAAELVRRRAADQSTTDLDANAAEVAWYIHVESRAARRREELASQ